MDESSALLELAVVDVDILRASKRLDSLPEKREILEVRAKLREVNGFHEKAEMLVRKLDAEVKLRQDEISMLREKLAGEQTKVMQTADHRQIQALTREMDGLRRRVDKLEMETLQFMERIEKANAQLVTIDSALASLSGKEAALIDRFRTVGAELQDEIAALERTRGSIAKSISPEMLGRYESIRDSKGGVGVGRLEATTCSACRMSLPAERIQDLLAGPDVGVCPQCRRLIVVRSPSER
jgi:predicted  nucleic acid-binding Zn-ribbon protein